MHIVKLGYNKLVLIGRKFNQKKTIGSSCTLDTPLKRCLGTLDLTLMGLGSMIGAGVYVLTGEQARSVSGPGVLLAYFIAGIFSLLTAICYAELAAQIPKSGTTYSYVYVAFGEIWAFLAGWDGVIRGLLCTAAIAKTMSAHLKLIIGSANSSTSMHNSTLDQLQSGKTNSGNASSEESGLSGFRLLVSGDLLVDSPDWLALVLIVAVALFAALGVNISSKLNGIFTTVSAGVILVIVCYGSTFGSTRNWSAENGGFLPFGFDGVLRSAGVCFLAFSGFEGIASAGEETRKPARSIPIALCTSMVVVICCYCSLAVVLTLMVPYTRIDMSAAFVVVFEQKGCFWTTYVVAVGACSGMTTTLLGGMFSLPRLLYSMANDRLIFRIFGKVNCKLKVPLIAMIFCASFAGILATFVCVQPLLKVAMIGRLIACNAVCGAVLTLRYRNGSRSNCPTILSRSRNWIPHTWWPFTRSFHGVYIISANVANGSSSQLSSLPAHLSVPAVNSLGSTNRGIRAIVTDTIVKYSSISIVLLSAVAAALLARVNVLKSPSWWTTTLLVLCAAGVFVAYVLIQLQKQPRRDTTVNTFRMPCVPLIPIVCIVVNIILLSRVDATAWVQYATILACGFLAHLAHSCVKVQGLDTAQQ